MRKIASVVCVKHDEGRALLQLKRCMLWLQALSNAVFAFEKAGLLRKEFLSGVFEVAGLRLLANESQATLTFKPQVGWLRDLCRANEYSTHHVRSQGEIPTCRRF